MFPGTWKASKSCRCLVPQTEPASLGWESTPPRPLGSCLHCPALPSPARLQACGGCTWATAWCPAVGAF